MKKKATPETVDKVVETTEIVNAIPDFKMNSIEGNPISIKEEVAKNKITILDFWASWCGPCMHEVPNMIALYNQYNDKGMGMVGISLDEDSTEWKCAVKNMGMNWTHISDLQGWQNQAAQLFGVQSIPHIVIVDSAGIILSQGLRGQELENFIAEKLK